jgi:hypothetical protein
MVFSGIQWLWLRDAATVSIFDVVAAYLQYLYSSW